MSSNATTQLESNGGAPSPNEPLITNSNQNFKITLDDDDMAKTLEEKEDAAVYKSTVDKVEIKQPIKYVGLTKEELEQYVNDPYWKKLRYIFLGLFWLLWIAMFAAAVIIVIMSPKCPPKPQLKWWQKKTCYQIWTKSYKDSNGDGVGDLNGIAHQIKYIGAFKTSAIWPTPVLKSHSGSGYDVVDHKDVDPAIGTVQDFSDMIETAHQKDMYVVMDLPLTTVSTSHEWFQKSVRNEGEYVDYFHWRKEQPADTKTWSLSPERNAYYKHWGTNRTYALLNWDTKAVRDTMLNAAMFWLKHKVDGFYLGEVQYMSITNGAQNTPNWEKIHTYLQELNKNLRSNEEKREIATFTSHGFNEPAYGISVDEFKLAMTVQADVDYVINNELVMANQTCESECLYGHLKKVLDYHVNKNVSWPMWEIGHPFVSRVATRMGNRTRGEMLLLLMLNLPGSINVYYGDEIGMVDGTNGRKANLARTPMQWSSEEQAGFSTNNNLPIPVNEDYKTVNYKAQNKATRSTLKMLKRMTALRQTEDSFLHGNLTLVQPSASDNVLLLNVSSNYSSTHYVAVLNFGPAQTFDFTKVPYNLTAVGYDASFITGTTNVFDRGGFVERESVKPTHIQLQTDEAIVIRFKTAK